jgi:hypothetical protein
VIGGARGQHDGRASRREPATGRLGRRYYTDGGSGVKRPEKAIVSPFGSRCRTVSKVSPTELQEAVERLHDCKAVLIATEDVLETIEGKTVWEGEVHHFVLSGHPSADMAYAWSSPIEGSTERKFFAVLRAPPVNSAQSAVRAAIGAA